jgi:hypothetical protein
MASDGTHIHRLMLPDPSGMRGSLHRLLMHHSANSPGVSTNRAEGRSYFSQKWLSGNGLHLSHVGELQALSEAIRRQADATDPRFAPLRIFNMWAIVSRRGMQGAKHRHNGRFSSAYYVDAGDSGEAGGEFLHCSDDGRVIERIMPRSGMLMLFPSSLLHCVTAYQSDRPRIVISANLA